MRVSNKVTSRAQPSTSKIPPQSREAFAGLVEALAEFGGGQHEASDPAGMEEVFTNAAP
jgi:hypothetical protein